MTILSDCGTYRYTLTRRIPCALRWVNPVLFIMLNPSIANATIPDPTTTRCINYAKSWSNTDLTIVNLFALISTEPKELISHADPVGPDNDKHIMEQIEKHILGDIVLGWGADKFARGRAEKLKELLNGREVSCLVQNKDLSPRHPLYCAGNLQLQKFIWK